MKSKLWQTVLSTRYLILLIGCLISGCSMLINYAEDLGGPFTDPHIPIYRYTPDKHLPDIMVTRYYESEINQLTNAIKKDPSDVESYMKRAELYANAAEHSQAIDDYLVVKKILFSVRTSDVEIETRLKNQLGKVYVFRGIDHWHADEFDLAIKDYSAALKLDVDDSNALYHRWQTYKYIENEVKAKQDYQRGLKLNPEKFQKNYSSDTINHRHIGGVI